MSALARSSSLSAPRMSELEPRPAHSLTRYSSKVDVNDFTRYVDRFQPGQSLLAHNDSTPLWSSRYYRPSYNLDSYWWDRFYYFSPVYRGTQPYKRHYASHRITFPCSSNQPYTYWGRHNGYYYDSENDFKPLYRRCFEPFFGDSAYKQRFWNRYNSHILNNDVY